jgi:signal transduction histidine kinase
VDFTLQPIRDDSGQVILLQSTGIEPELKAKEHIFAGDGEMARIMRDLDWSKTPLGPVQWWSPVLRMMTPFLLANRFPMLLWWGPQFCQLYNDAYRPILGTKHPHFLGRPVSECWHEIWHVLEPLIQTPFQGGPATWMDDILLEPNRHGFTEESHFTIAYSPVPDDTSTRGIGGVLATVHEITEKVVGERRTKALRDLGARSIEAKTAEEACTRAARILANYAKDIPFVLLYLFAPDRKSVHLAGTAGIEMRSTHVPEVIPLAGSSTVWPIMEICESEEILVVSDLEKRLGTVPPGPWSDPPGAAAVLPISSNVAHEPTGFLVAGLSPRLHFDDGYRVFLELVSSQIGTVIAHATAREEERKRAEKLTEVDRAKTIFFSNVSHEFRTPLTLLLGPLEEMLAKPAKDVLADNRHLAVIAHRNGIRLLKLVNTLLDFSRIEAGRTEARYQPTDLAAFTTDLASLFRSATDRAGLKLTVECDPLDQPVYIDRDMWEKIVLNLLSNAFKFTFQGEIAVRLQQNDGTAELSVRDTGVGIPEEELPRLFKRFHRIEGTRGRSFEGSGIGLSLVQELVKLHGGSISVESAVNEGTSFRVRIPLGSLHLPQLQVSNGTETLAHGASTSPYVTEALSWLSTTSSGDETAEISQELPQAQRTKSASSKRILLVDDNADMREYVQRLLSPHFQVTGANNGRTALDHALKDPPDLVLTDIMMPEMDGFELLAALRKNSATSTIPIILLSARAGAEARIEGLQQGPDDYLTKPFSARELLARVHTHLELAEVRKNAIEAIRQNEERLRKMEKMAAAGMLAWSLAHEINNPLAAVMNSLYLLRTYPALDETARGFAITGATELDRVARIAKQMLSYHHSGAQPSDLDMSEVVNESLTIFADRFHRTGVNVTRKLHPGSFIFGVADEIRQVVDNLLLNAVEAMPDGGQLTISVSPCGNSDQSRKEGVRITIADSGPGISKELRSQIFDAFFTTKPEKGAGLGLWVARGIITKYGGTIRLKSSNVPGRSGAVFSVFLPSHTITKMETASSELAA